MFTGIVADVGEVVGSEETDEGVRLQLAGASAGADESAEADESAGADESAAGETALAGLAPGASICVSGACLTVEDRVRADGHDSVDDGRDLVSVFLANETRERTYLGDLRVGDGVNLEPGLPADGRLDGHVVQGHVDGTTTVEAIRQVGDDWEFTFALPDGLEQYVVEKGFVALDGISLTVASLDGARGTFSVAIIPETYRRTTLSEKAPGDPVNVEVDVLAKYVERMLDSGGYGAGE